MVKDKAMFLTLTNSQENPFYKSMTIDSMKQMTFALTNQADGDSVSQAERTDSGRV